MTESSVIYIILAFITALLLALFQYVYKSKLNNRLKTILAVLRTVAVFGILLLLINKSLFGKWFTFSLCKLKPLTARYFLLSVNTPPS